MNLSPLLLLSPRRVLAKNSAADSGSAVDGRHQFRLSDGLASAAATGGVTSASAPIAAALPPEPAGLPELTAPMAGPVFPADRQILKDFASDIATAPEIVGELTALYVEQHPRLAIRFVARAAAFRPWAVEDIERAATRRQGYGLHRLAALMLSALDLVTAPREAAVLLPAYLDVLDDSELPWAEGPVLAHLQPVADPPPISADELLASEIDDRLV